MMRYEFEFSSLTNSFRIMGVMMFLRNPDQRDKTLLIKSKPMQKMHQFDLLETKMHFWILLGTFVVLCSCGTIGNVFEVESVKLPSKPILATGQVPQQPSSPAIHPSAPSSLTGTGACRPLVEAVGVDIKFADDDITSGSEKIPTFEIT